MSPTPYGAIILRNARRALEDSSGYSLVNLELAKGADFGDAELPGLLKKGDGDIHLFASPPYSFRPRINRLNVGLTMTQRADLSEYPFEFVRRCNEMDLLIVPSELQKVIFYGNGITRPIQVLPLGVDYETWKATARNGPNQFVLIIDRGREHAGSARTAAKYFKADVLGKSAPRITRDQLHARYAAADVFLKWTNRRGPGEGWCFPILEAMSAGCLVMTNSDLPYLTEGNHLHFEDEAGLTRCLDRASKESLIALKVAGQETAKGLTWERVREGLREILDSFYRRLG